jgi:hypothetical protein
MPMPLALAWFWWGGGILYALLLISAGVMTLRNGHALLFILGISSPALDLRRVHVAEAKLLIRYRRELNE